VTGRPKIASAGTPAVRHQRTLTLIAICAFVACGALPLLIGQGKWLYAWIDGCFVVAALAAAFKCFLSARRLTDDERRAWLCFGFGSLAYGLGCIAWAIYEAAGVYTPMPSVADFGMLSMPLFFIAGLWYYRTRATTLGVKLVQIGNLGIIIAVILIANLVLFHDAFQRANDSLVTMTSITYEVFDAATLLFGLITISFYSWGRRRLVTALIVTGIFTLAVANFISSHGILRLGYTAIDPINTLYLACFGFIYWAAFEQDQLEHVDEAAQPTPESEARAKQLETLLPPIAVACVLVAVLYYRAGLSLALLPLIAGAAALFIVSMAVRDWWSHRVEADLRAQALTGKAQLQDSERRLREKNEELFDANRELREEIKTRVRIQEELRHAQKLEALGQLTGGVAHDFNNLLAVIFGNLELLEQQLEARGDLHELAHEASVAAERGAQLTQRLLAFSRKQQLRPASTDVRALLENMRTFFERTLGEMVQIAIETPTDLWPCHADPAQLENALLNLAINARDAMPDGGELVLEASNARLGEDQALSAPELSAGDYLRVSVSDSGMGMSSEVQAKAFEPFFTTKEVGAGSGLGLSMVYGFARQSGGHVQVQSEAGGGTQITLYLPRSEEPVARAKGRVVGGIPAGRGESILVVEDEAAVRKLVVTLLRDLGYEVTEASDAAEALAALHDLPSLRLILSDVVLSGGMSGRDLAREVGVRRPEVEVAFMSGYSADVFSGDGARDDDAVLLRKPFKRAELARKIRTILDASR
jgi:signal transduction histidine kinase